MREKLDVFIVVEDAGVATGLLGHPGVDSFVDAQLPAALPVGSRTFGGKGHT